MSTLFEGTSMFSDLGNEEESTKRPRSGYQ